MGGRQAGLRQWLLNSISIRLRLALWYGALLTVTLTLFSLVVLAVAQYQLETSVDASLLGDAQLVARTLQTELATTPATPTASPAASPTATTSPTATATANGGATPTVAPTAVPTPDPAQSKKIQQQLLLSSDARDLLGRFDLTFEVLNRSGKVAYYAPNISNTGLPLDAGAAGAALHAGACGSYTRSQGASLLRIYVYPVVLPSDSAAGLTGTHVTAPTCAGTPGGVVVGAVVVAKPVDDVGRTLATLRQILVFGVVVAVIFTSLGSWLIAGSGLQPIAAVTKTAKAIAMNAHAAGLGRRVDYRGPRDEVGALAETFDQMLAALERVANAQQRFVADASHELRAPLTTIKGSLELLRRARDLPEAEREAAIEDAYAEAERMAALVNDLLLLARVDAAGASGRHAALVDDQMRGRREPVELDQLVMEIFRYGRAQLQARHRAAQLQLKVETLEPVAAMADPRQLRQVMLILMDNAIKYTPSGGQIRLSARAQGSRVALSVADTGIGIAPELLPHIFERFFRGDEARERDQHGSGLGLAIAQWIITVHNGEIAVESQPGKGSVFTVLLPALRHRGDAPSTKHPAVTRIRPARSVVAGAMARLAQNVSRPRLTAGSSEQSEQGTPGRKQSTRGARAARDRQNGRGSQSTSPDATGNGTGNGNGAHSGASASGRPHDRRTGGAGNGRLTGRGRGRGV